MLAGLFGRGFSQLSWHADRTHKVLVLEEAPLTGVARSPT